MAAKNVQLNWLYCIRGQVHYLDQLTKTALCKDVLHLSCSSSHSAVCLNSFYVCFARMIYESVLNHQTDASGGDDVEIKCIFTTDFGLSSLTPFPIPEDMKMAQVI